MDNKTAALLDHARDAHAAAHDAEDLHGLGAAARRAAEQYMVVLFRVFEAEMPSAKGSDKPTLGAFLSSHAADEDGARLVDAALKAELHYLQGVGNQLVHARLSLSEPIPTDRGLVLAHLDQVAEIVEARLARRWPHLEDAPAPQAASPRRSWVIWPLAAAALAAAAYAVTLSALEPTATPAVVSPRDLNAPAPPASAQLGDVGDVVEVPASLPSPVGGPSSATPAPEPPHAPPPGRAPVDEAVDAVIAGRPPSPEVRQELDCDDLMWVRNWVWAKEGARLADPEQARRFAADPRYTQRANRVATPLRGQPRDQRIARELGEALEARGCGCREEIAAQAPCPR